MADTTRRHFLALALALLAPALSAEAQLIGNNRGGWSIRGTDPIEVFHGDRRVTAYHPAYGSGIPYFSPMVGPNGKTYTDATPAADGLHTLGAWFALENVNGYDFRNEPEEPRRAGKILHKGMNGVIIKGDTLTIRTKSEWLDKEDPIRRICSDRREITFFHLDDDTLVFDIVLELIADAGDLELGDESLGGWSLRVIPSLQFTTDSTGVSLSNSTGEENAEVPDKAAAWVACHGHDNQEKPISIAILDHPDNLNAPAVWTFSESGIISANPLSESSSDSRPSPHVIPNGESIFLRYRTLFYQGDPVDLDVAKVFDRYSK